MDAAAPNSTPTLILSWVGVVLHLALGVFPLATLGLVAPMWGVAVIYLLWALIGLAAWRARAERWWAPLAGFVLTLGVVTAVLSAGDILLGWTA